MKFTDEVISVLIKSVFIFCVCFMWSKESGNKKNEREKIIKFYLLNFWEEKKRKKIVRHECTSKMRKRNICSVKDGSIKFKKGIFGWISPCESWTIQRKMLWFHEKHYATCTHPHKPEKWIFKKESISLWNFEEIKLKLMMFCARILNIFHTL